MNIQTVTRAIETDLDPETVFATVSNPALLPSWAPAFADSITHEAGSSYGVTKDGQAFVVEVISSQQSLTVDFLRQMADGRRGGAYIRVTPRPINGSTITMTVPVAADVAPAEVESVLNL